MWLLVILEENKTLKASRFLLASSKCYYTSQNHNLGWTNNRQFPETAPLGQMVVVSVVLSIRFNSGLRSPKRRIVVSEGNLLHVDRSPYVLKSVLFDVEKTPHPLVVKIEAVVNFWLGPIYTLQ